MDICFPVFEFKNPFFHILSIHYVYNISKNQLTVNFSDRMTFIKEILDDAMHFTFALSVIELEAAALSSDTLILNNSDSHENGKMSV